MVMLYTLVQIQIHDANRMIQPIPEPGTIGLMVVAAVGLVIVGMIRRGKKGREGQ